MTDIPHEAWIVVGDSEKALILYNEGDEKYPNLQVIETITEDNPATHEQGADRPGRYNDGPSPQKSAMGDTDWHEQQKDRFARQLADRLYAAAHKDSFRKLILVAPPHFLGQLRDHLHDEVTERLVAEIDKTLTSHPVDRIEKVLTSS